MKRIRLKSINLPEEVESNWVEYEFEELAEEPEGMVSKEAVLKVFDEFNKQSAIVMGVKSVMPTIVVMIQEYVGKLRKALSEM